jgi:tol-pal system protein YbgF
MTKSIAIAAVLSLVAPILPAADLEGRVTRIENILNNQRSSDLLLQIQRLQAEIQLLRGAMEQQRFDLEALKRHQKEQYLDLEARLRGQGSGGPPEGQPPAESAAVPAEAAQSADGTAVPKPPAETPGSPPAPDSAQAGAESAQPPLGERETYRKAFDQLKQRRYDEAVSSFNDLLARYPKGEFADNAHYWLGETFYVKRDYAAALSEFQQVVRSYPLSPKVAGSMLKIGYIQDEQKDRAKARATLEGLVEKFPDSAEARLAKGRLQRLTSEGN